VSCAHNRPFPERSARQDQAASNGQITIARTITGIHVGTADGILRRVPARVRYLRQRGFRRAVHVMERHCPVPEGETR
jgi:hypothetical protein